MSDKKTIIKDKMLKAQLKEIACRLNISVDELIDRYIRRGVYVDYGYHNPKPITLEYLLETHKKRIEKDIEKGFTPKKHNFDFFIGLINESEDD